MGVPIPASVYCQYNGITFPANIRTKVNEEPVYSGDGRTVKYSRITIDIAGYWTQDDAGFTYTLNGGDAGDAGTGYEEGDVLTVVGGTFTAAMQITVVSVDEFGAVTDYSLLDDGAYTVLPASPAGVTGGNGNGFTVNFSVQTQTPNTLDAFMQSVRLRLNASGKFLRYTGKGYGLDLIVNSPGGDGVRDVAMGPRVSGKFLFWSLGGAPDGCHGAGFSWSVSTCIPECSSARYTPGPNVFTEVFFSVVFDTDEAGLVTITTRGSLSIPLSLQADNSLSDNVDTYFATVVAPVSPGFLRKINRELTPDRATCNFTITDRQVEVPFPNGVVHMDMKHSIKQNGISAATWDSSITGTVRMAPGFPKGQAFVQFFAIVFQRIAWSRSGVGRLQSNGKPNIFPPILEIEEDLFKNEAHFSVRYKILECSLQNILVVSGLWRPVDQGSNLAQLWTATTWRDSLGTAPTWLNSQGSEVPGAINGNNAQTPLGLLGASFSNSSEVIIDVCNYAVGGSGGGGDDDGGGSVGLSGAGAFLGTATLAVTPDQEVDDEEDQLSDSEIAVVEPINFLLETPEADGQLADQGESQYDPDTAWVNWHCEVRPITDHHQIRHKPLSGTVSYTEPEIDPLGDVEDVADNTADQTPGWNGTVPDIIQQTSSPSMMLELRGFGVRLAYRVQPPKLISFGGVTPILQYEETPESTLAMSGGVVLYRTDWVLRYLLPSAPDSIPLPANPFLGIDGDA